MSIKKAEYILILLLLFQFLFFSPFVVDINFEIIMFAFTSMLIFILASPLTIQYIFSKSNYYLNTFLVLTIINAVWSQLNGNSPGDIMRSILPFLYLFMLIIASSTLSYLQFKKIILMLVSIIYILALKDLFLLVQSGNLFNPYYRITYDSIYSALPYNILLVTYILLYVKNKLKFLLMSVPLIIIVQSQSKGLIGITTLIMLFWFIYTSKNKFSSAIKVFIGIVLLFILIQNIESIPMLNRFAIIGSESDVTTFGRLQEIGQAVEYFVNHPIFGNGAGTVFMHILDDGFIEERRYTHNVVFYFLAIGGLPMLLSYIYVYMKSIYRSFSLMKVPYLKEYKKDILFILLSLSVLILYSMVSATYKLIHTNIILGLLISYLSYFTQLLRKKNECTKNK